MHAKVFEFSRLSSEYNRKYGERERDLLHTHNFDENGYENHCTCVFACPYDAVKYECVHIFNSHKHAVIDVGLVLLWMD